MHLSLTERAAALCVLVLLLLLPTPAEACSCYESHFATVPSSGSELPVDGRIVLDGSGSWSKQLGSLGRQGLMLVSGREKVPLRVQKVFEGAGRRSAALLVPASRLKNGRRYSLVVRPPGKKEPIPLLFEGKTIEWKAVAATPRRASAPQVQPVLGKVTVSDGDCGPSISVGVQLPDGLGNVVLVSMTGPHGSSSYPLRVIDQAFELTWGPCGGIFRLEPGQRYSLEVSGTSRDLSPVETKKGSLEVQIPLVGAAPPSP
jgi:hypothetical protein